MADEVTDKIRKERTEFHIPKLNRERSLYGSEFEIQLRNKLTQRAIAKECADWMRRKASFRPTARRRRCSSSPACKAQMPTRPTCRCTASPPWIWAISKATRSRTSSTRSTSRPITATYLRLFDQIWNDPEKLEDVTDCDLRPHRHRSIRRTRPERIYFLMLYNIFNEFLEDIDEDVLPNDRTGYQDTLIWKKLFNFQRDAATGIINKLETYSGCILADSVGLGKTFTALAVIKYYELRNRSVLVLCPKKLADNWLNYNRNLKTNIFAKDRFNYDVLCHTDLSRTSGESLGMPLNRVNWGNYDLVVIDESHNFRNNDAFKEQGDALPAADEPGHPRRREDQGADALGHPGQQPLQRPAQPARARLRRRLREPQQEAAHRQDDRRDLPRRADGLQRVVQAAARGAHGTRHPATLWTSTSSSCWTA